MRDFGAWWCSVKSNGLFTHRLPRSTLLHWLLIYIFWFIEAHASYFNQGSPHHPPPSHWLTIPFSPTMHINSKKYNQFYDRLCFFSTWWVNIAFWKWPVHIVNLQIDPLGWKAISAERTQSQGWACERMAAIWFLLFFMFVSKIQFQGGTEYTDKDGHKHIIWLSARTKLQVRRLSGCKMRTRVSQNRWELVQNVHRE